MRGTVSGEDRVYSQSEIGERERRNRVAAPRSPHRCIASVVGLAADLDTAPRQVHEPHLRDARRRVTWQLVLAVPCERTVSDLNEEENVGGPPVAGRGTVGAVPPGQHVG